MNGLASSFFSLPKPLQAAIGVAGGGSITAAIVLAFTGYGSVALVIVAGLALLALLLVGYKALLKWRQSAKANPFLRDIAESSSAVPQGAAAASRARLDDMRKRFEKGLTTFKAHGKNIYSLPWYVIVGEPGSGKTELIRHCKIGFPPGLQDELQGVGGTVNMDWWFTDHAVILDTAGRLILEDIDSTSTSEWKEFLKLLARHRVNCPINGLLLAIPADSLIKDTSEAIERKAGRISRQLDEIQRTLGVRFPVFIVITKADLVNGFREFFDDIGEPQFQDQMFGWSNASSLDEEFKPEVIEKHLDSIRTRLMRRRLAVMRDPVHTDDANGRRIDQVDSLYAFPDSIKMLGPRLRRYLELIFVGGTWATKPLFLRGVYFASSMREGDELDEELAKLHGVAVESLPGGRGAWARDKAYFIRDLFLNKVFREKGLVTRASNTKKLQQRRRTALLATAGGGMVLVFALTMWGYLQLSADVLNPTRYWEKINKYAASKVGSYQIVYPHAVNKAEMYGGDTPIDELDITLMEALNEIRKQAESDIRVNPVFVPVNQGTALLADERVHACQAFYEKTVLQPLVNEARIHLAKETQWNATAAEALAQLVRIEVAATKTADAKLPQLAPLFKYLLDETDPKPANRFAEYQSDVEKLQAMCDWLYGEEHKKAWPPAFVVDDALAVSSRKAPDVQTAVDRLVASMGGDASDAQSPLGQLAQLVSSLNQFCVAEWDLFRLDENAEQSLAKPPLESWSVSYATLKESAEAIEARVAVLNGRTLQDAYREMLSNIAKSYDAILTEFSPLGEAASGTAAVKSLATARGKLTEAQAALHNSAAVDAKAAQYAFLNGAYLATLRDGLRSFQCRAQIYGKLNEELLTNFDESSTDWLVASSLKESLDQRLKTAQSDPNLALVRSQIKQTNAPLDPIQPGDACQQRTDHNQQADKLATYALGWANELQTKSLLAACLGNMPNSSELMAESVELQHQKVSTENPNVVFPSITLTKLGAEKPLAMEQRYMPQQAASMFKSWEAIGALYKGEAPAASPRFKDLNQAFGAKEKVLSEYLTAYVSYWAKDVADLARVDLSGLTWPQFITQARALRDKETNEKLLDLNEQADRALKSAEPLKSLLSQRDQEMLAAAGGGLKAEADVLGKSKKCRVIRDSWLDLGDDVGNTVTKLLAKRGPDIADDLFALYDADSDDESVSWRRAGGYWGQLSIEALELLAREANRDCHAALGALLQPRYRKFPLCAPDAMMIANSQTSMLTGKEFEDARALYQQVMRNRPTSGQATTAAPKVNLKHVDDLLDELSGKGMAGLDSPVMKKLAELFTVVGGLQIELVALDPMMHSSSQPISAERVPIFKDPNVPPLTSVTRDYPFMEITIGKTRLTNIYGNNRLKSEFTDVDPARKGDRTFKLPGEQMTFEFFNDRGSLKSTQLDAWPLLWAMQSAVPVRKMNEENKPYWAVPIIVRDAANKPVHYYWVGVQCTPDLIPEMLDKRWPTLDDWSAAGVR